MPFYLLKQHSFLINALLKQHAVFFNQCRTKTTFILINALLKQHSF